MSEIEDQFEAAVTVIQGLPKGGRLHKRNKSNCITAI